MSEVTVNIRGYRQLSEFEQKAINEAKALGDSLGAVVAAMRTQSNIDQRWLSIAETHLQQGMMALVRSIAKPEGF